MAMTSRERMLAAITREQAPDRLPVTTHHIMPYFLNKHMGGMGTQEFFDCLGFDAITWELQHRPDEGQGEFADPNQRKLGFLESQRVATENWRVDCEDLPDPQFKTTRYYFRTPKGTLTMVLQANDQTAWIAEYLIKEKRDIELLGQFMTHPKCDVAAVNRAAEAFGERGIVRGHICGFDVFGQAGVWQDAACIVPLESLIMATYDDPAWVHELLRILMERKLTYIRSSEGAKYDLFEGGGGAASSTVISPKLFEQFVAPYDTPLIEAAHAVGQRVAYHTCGGMMPILELIAEMGPDCMETLTPPAMGGDMNLAEAKRRVGDRVCLIGGFDQFHGFLGCSEAETRAEVRRCFAEVGPGGGYILSPSDHFFDADPELIKAFVDEARKCSY